MLRVLLFPDGRVYSEETRSRVVVHNLSVKETAMPENSDAIEDTTATEEVQLGAAIPDDVQKTAGRGAKSDAPAEAAHPPAKDTRSAS